ncbi:hypothetical protein BH18ACI5_BH18ACI5_20490 [soil metagenome]
MTQLHALLSHVRRRWFVSVALRTIGLAAAAAAVPVVAAILLDRLLAPTGTPLMLLVAAACVLALAAAAMVGFRIERRPNDRRVARFIEERASCLPGVGALDDCVVTAVDASAGKPEHAGFATLIVAAATRRLEGISASDLIPSSGLWRAAATAVAGATALGVLLTLGFPSLTRAIETARLRLFPQAITVDVLPGDARIPGGNAMKIRARVRSGGRDFTQLAPQLVLRSGADQRTVPMVRAGEGFEFDIGSIDRSFRYQVKAGSSSSPEFNVTALFPPRVQRIDIRYDYPSFSGLAARDEQDGGDIYAPAGTRVRLRIHTDKSIATGELAMSSGRVSLKSAGDKAVDAEFMLTRDDSYRVRLSDKDGLSADGDSEYFIRLMDDRPPDVRILRPSSDQGITPLEEVTIEARSDDDHGVSTLELIYAVGGGREHVIPFSRISGTPIQKVGAHLLAAEDLDVRPGDVITYYARARDIGRGKRPTETKSDIFFLEVKPFNEEFVAAQSQAGAQASGDPQIDSLISAQKEIISATWNVERRARGGRSADDVANIAKAQAELKAKVERLAGTGRSRRIRPPAPERQTSQPQPPTAAEGMGAAVEAMTRAIEQLATQKTREAIPHEMAALNVLLQAQAEVRRRQVTQQANGGGGGGGNRSGQDLSALFDKELQRQQQTNYEQRTQVEERASQEQRGDDALDRIKDLARRQEEINRKQRELAQLAAEERKRELEKLTRDQQELRQQAEELARQMGQQQGAPQGRGTSQSRQQQQQQQSSQNASGGSNMRDAAEQMRSAAEQMRREDAARAQQSGERAADQLRRMEQQMRGASPDSRQRAAGELRSEAQQVAQEQRRIAAEAERLEKDRASSSEARERLASEKERLADRVDELKRSAQQLGRDGKDGEQATNARAAASDIERERIGQRMRDSATQMRQSQPSPQGAYGEQQLARALDEVVDKLGGAATTDARKLSEQLDRTRELRNRLDALEAQMRQAAGKNDGSLEKLQQQYANEMNRAQQAMGDRAGAGEQRNGAGSTPESQEFSRSAPGTQAFKQDRSQWESLRKDLNRALEQHDAAVAKRLTSTLGDARLSAGGSERVPEDYRRFIARYYESLAKVKK